MADDSRTLVAPQFVWDILPSFSLRYNTLIHFLNPSQHSLLLIRLLKETAVPTRRYISQVKPELRPSLDDILNHPFLRNGGPRQRFSTSHGLRGSSASSSPPSSAVTGGGGGGGSTSTASRLASQKHSNTPERCAASGGFGRPPLKTRSSNVEAEAAEGGGGGGVTATAEGAARLAKPRSGTPAPAGMLLGVLESAVCRSLVLVGRFVPICPSPV